jgi:hypothetical protein
VYGYEFTNLLLQVQGSPTNNWVALIRKFDFQQTYLCEGISCTIPLPSSAVVTTGTLYIDVITGNEICGEDQESIVGTHLCRSQDCLFCLNAYEHLSCLEPSESAFLWSVTIIALLVVICMIPTMAVFSFWLVKVVVCLPFDVFKFMKSLYNSNFTNDMIGYYKRADGYFRMKDAPEEKEVEVEKEKEEKWWRKNRGRGNAKNASMTGLVLMMLLRGGFGIALDMGPWQLPCSSSSVLGAEYFVCENFGTYQNCTLNMNVVAFVPFPDTSACITLVQLDNNQINETVATIEIQFNYAIDRINLANSYVTSCWTTSGCTQFHNYCKGSGGCASENTCSNIAANTRPESQDFSGCPLTHPGPYTCVKCQNCGPNWACAEGAVGIVPTGSIYQVKTMGQRTLTPTVTVIITDELGNTDTKTTSVTGVSIDVNGEYSMQLIGLIGGTTSTFNTNSKVIWNLANNADVWIGSASDVNVPHARNVGDIQATTSTALLTASKTAFIWDRAAISTVQSCPAPGFTVAQCGIANMVSPNYIQFPNVFGPDLWSQDPATNSIFAEATSPGAMTVSLSFQGGYAISTVINIVCPTFTISAATGCYDCQAGFVLVILARSTCAQGLATITVDDPTIQIFTSSVNLATGPNEYTVYGATSQEENSFQMCLTSGSNSYCQTVEFVAAPVLPYLSQNVTGVTCDTEGNCAPPSGGKNKHNLWKGKITGTSFFEDLIPKWFKGVFQGLFQKWWKYLVLIIFLILLVPFTIFLFKGILWLNNQFAPSYKITQQMNKMANREGEKGSKQN